jgi:GT2 family glycosyltransferase
VHLKRISLDLSKMITLVWKAWIAGYKMMFASSSIVYHFGGQTIKNLKTQ